MKDFKSLNVGFLVALSVFHHLPTARPPPPQIALGVLGFPKETILEVYSILSAVLLLGNVDFNAEVNQVTGIDTISVRRPANDDGSIFFLSESPQNSF